MPLTIQKIDKVNAVLVFAEDLSQLDIGSQIQPLLNKGRSNRPSIVFSPENVNVKAIRFLESTETMMIEGNRLRYEKEAIPSIKSVEIVKELDKMKPLFEKKTMIAYGYNYFCTWKSDSPIKSSVFNEQVAAPTTLGHTITSALSVTYNSPQYPQRTCVIELANDASDASILRSHLNMNCGSAPSSWAEVERGLMEGYSELERAIKLLNL